MSTEDKLKSELNLGPDSGFLSGVCNTEDEIESHYPDETANHREEDEDSSQSSSQQPQAYNRLDSGVDVEDQLTSLSTLNIKEDAAEPSSSKSLINQPQQQQCLSWEDYFTQRDSEGDTLLHLAILQQSESTVLSILRLCPNPLLLNLQNDRSQSALHYAVLTQQSKLTRWLIIAGVNSCLQDSHGNTVVHYCAVNGDLDCLEAVLRPVTGLEVNTMGLKYEAVIGSSAALASDLVDLYNYDGQSALHLSTINNNSDMIRALYEFGGNINQLDMKGGRTCLHYSIERCHLSCIEVILQYCQPNTTLVNYNGKNIGQMSFAASNSTQIKALLSKYGVNLVNNDDDYIEDESEDEDEEDDELTTFSWNNQQQQKQSPISPVVSCSS